jgi:hypothetical protein
MAVLCPACRGALTPVTYPSDSYLNEDQWRSIRAGDYYCPTCPRLPYAGQAHYRYYWADELPAIGGTTDV